MNSVFASAQHLQFIFRCIDHKDPDKPYMLTLSINEEGAYEGMHKAYIQYKCYSLYPYVCTEFRTHSVYTQLQTILVDE